MGPPRHVLVGALVLAFAAARSRPARADEPPSLPLEIVGDGGRTWDALLHEIQEGPGTEGRTYAIGVRASGSLLDCGEYALSFDDVGRAAFSVQGCDASTGMTQVRVVDRAPLFDVGGFVPRPRRASVYAVRVQRGRAEGGGERATGGSRATCSVRLEPYLWDALHGVHVALPWDRFLVRPLAEDIRAAPDGKGWIARGESAMSVRFRYEVIDRTTGERVLENEATLACEDRPARPAPPAEPGWAPLPSPTPVALPPLETTLPAPESASEPPPTVHADFTDRSVASLKLSVVELAAVRTDAARFRGAFQLAPYNGALDFAGGLQLGITNTAGAHPWGLPSPPPGAGKRRITTDDEPPRPIAFRGVGQIGVVNAVDGGFSGLAQIGLVSITEGPFRGLAQVGVLGAGMGNESIAGLQLGGLMAYAKKITGLQLTGGVAFAETVHGVQLGASGNLASRSVVGVEIGSSNMVISARRRGEPELQASVEGAQIGGMNWAEHVTGAQIGAINIATTARGVQIGAINYAGHLRGVQIGAINIAANGVVPFMPVLNAAFGG